MILSDEWNQTFDLTEKMLQAARNSQWDDLTELESTRRNLIFQIFSPPEYNPAPTDSECLSQLQNLDQQIISLCHAGQQVLAHQIKVLQLGKRVNQAYNF